MITHTLLHLRPATAALVASTLVLGCGSADSSVDTSGAQLGDATASIASTPWTGTFGDSSSTTMDDGSELRLTRTLRVDANSLLFEEVGTSIAAENSLTMHVRCRANDFDVSDEIVVPAQCYFSLRAWADSMAAPAGAWDSFSYVRNGDRWNGRNASGAFELERGVPQP